VRSSRPTATVAVALLGIALGCSNPQSFIVLKLRVGSNDIATEITGVTDVVVTVNKALLDASVAQTLTYDARLVDGGSLTFTRMEDRTLSVSFSGDVGGTVTFQVVALDAQRCVVGVGEATQQIRKGASTEVSVELTSMRDCSADGGVPPDGGTDGATFTGCDPVTPGTRDAGVTTCSPVQTCQVNCAGRRNECIMGGSGPPGATCQTNADCQPGTQCFDYTATGCGTKVCLRFCGNDAECVAVGAGGGGPGSVCEGRVVCGAADTAYHTCTFNCDPTATAAVSGSRGGCPGSLSCLMPAGMDQVDCACPEPTRTKVNGEACTGPADCAPGFLCNATTSGRVCRAICRCNKDASGLCTTPNTCSIAATTCTSVSSNTLFGLCL
jgi:hypothetical protein